MTSPIIKLIDNIDQQIDHMRDENKKARHLTTIKLSKKLSKGMLEDAMSITCYGNLAGCCGPEKECPTQLAVCEALGIDPKELFDMKMKAVDAWLEIEVLNR